MFGFITTYSKPVYRVQSRLLMMRIFRALDIWILFFVLAWSKLEGLKRSSRPSLYQIKRPKDLRTFHAHVVSSAGVKPGKWWG